MINMEIYSAQKKKLNGPEGAKYFFPVEGGIFFLGPMYYGRSFGKKNCLTIIGRKIFATPGPLSFFFWPL